MKNHPFFLSMLLSTVLFAVCFALYVVTVFAPMAVPPHFHLPNIALLCLLTLLLHRLLSPEGGAPWLATTLLAAISFGLLPLCAGLVTADLAWRLALAGGGVAFQVTVFLALAIVLLLSLRSVVRRHFSPRITKTNIDSIIGATGVVLTPVNNIAALGQVQVNGVEWSARSTDSQTIPKDTLVKVDRIEGVKAFITKSV